MRRSPLSRCPTLRCSRTPSGWTTRSSLCRRWRRRRRLSSAARRVLLRRRGRRWRCGCRASSRRLCSRPPLTDGALRRLQWRSRRAAHRPPPPSTGALPSCPPSAAPQSLSPSAPALLCCACRSPARLSAALQCLRALGNLCIGDDAVRSALVAADAVASLVLALRRFPQRAVQRMAVGALANLVCGHGEAQRRLLELQPTPYIAALLTRATSASRPLRGGQSPSQQTPPFSSSR